MKFYYFSAFVFDMYMLHLKCKIVAGQIWAELMLPALSLSPFI